MSEEQKTIDWEKEAAGLKVSTDSYYKPKQGMNQVIFLDNGTAIKSKDFNKKDCEKIRFNISVDKMVKTWEVFRCYPGEKPSKNGLYGQIATFASKKGGLSEKAIFLNVVGNGKETKYTVIDPATLIQGGGQ